MASIDGSRKRRRSEGNPMWGACLKLVKTLATNKNGWPFSTPVDPIALGIPDYFQIIKTPMDLSTVEQKINNEQYNNIDELIRDVRQIWFNCRTYNGPEHDITKMGQALSDVFEKKIAEIKSKNWDLEAGSVEGEGEEYSDGRKTKVPKRASTGGPAGSVPAASVVRSNVPEMSFEEKRQLCILINNLDTKHLGKVVQIIHRALPDFLSQHQTDTEEVEINIEQLDNATLRELESYAKEVSK
jgi:hypothetical protein